MIKPTKMNVRFIRQSDDDAIQRVQNAVKNGAVTPIPGNSSLNRFMELRAKARAIDTNLDVRIKNKMPS